MTARHLFVLLGCVVSLLAQSPQKAAKPQFDVQVPAFRGVAPTFFAIGGQNGRPGMDAWTVVLESASHLAQAAQFYLDELKKQGFDVKEKTTNSRGVHYKLVSSTKGIQANLSAGGKSDRPKIALAISWLR